jgi:hypothetical protein
MAGEGLEAISSSTFNRDVAKPLTACPNLIRPQIRVARQRQPKEMKPSFKRVVLAFLFVGLSGICAAGPTVVPYPRAASVKVLDDKFVVVQEFKDSKQIKLAQSIFLRSKRVGGTQSYLKTPTHKIDFSDRWLIDINSGEIGCLSKKTMDVYQIDAQDLLVLRNLIETKA